MRGSRNFRYGWSFIFSHQLVNRVVRISLEKQLDPWVSIAPRRGGGGGPYQYFKVNLYPLVIFQGESGPAVLRLDPRMGTYHVNNSLLTE